MYVLVNVVSSIESLFHTADNMSEQKMGILVDTLQNVLDGVTPDSDGGKSLGWWTGLCLA